MNEKLAKKLTKILAKAGLEEDQIEKIISDVEGAMSEETVEEDGGNPEEAPLPPSEVEGELPPEEAPQEEVPVEEVAQEEIPQTDGSIEGALNELAAQEGEIPPQADVPAEPLPQEPALPQFDPSQVEQLMNDLGEANKTIEALAARIGSLEEALKGAGVISSDSKLGDETPRITPNANADQDDAFDNMLSVINGK